MIVHPTWYSGQHTENEWLIGAGNAVDTGKYFIIIPNMFGNGLSTSPSDAEAPAERGRFPGATRHDNVRQQHRRVTERFGIARLALVTGWSMGALQTYRWAALTADAAWADGWYESPPEKGRHGSMPAGASRGPSIAR